MREEELRWFHGRIDVVYGEGEEGKVKNDKTTAKDERIKVGFKGENGKKKYPLY